MLCLTSVIVMLKSVSYSPMYAVLASDAPGWFPLVSMAMFKLTRDSCMILVSHARINMSCKKCVGRDVQSASVDRLVVGTDMNFFRFIRFAFSCQANCCTESMSRYWPCVPCRHPLLIVSTQSFPLAARQSKLSHKLGEKVRNLRIDGFCMSMTWLWVWIQIIFRWWWLKLKLYDQSVIVDYHDMIRTCCSEYNG